VYLPFFIGSLIDICRLTFIVIGLRWPDKLACSKYWITLCFFLITGTFLGLKVTVDMTNGLEIAKIIWYGMHTIVITSYLTLYILIKSYYRSMLRHVNDNVREQISEDLRGLLVLFIAFILPALLLSPFPFWI